MPYWGSRNDEAVDDFDDYDPTPYSGGYDQALVYGRPLPHSDETCYSISTPGDIDYDRPNYSSNSQTSVYETDEASFGDRYGHPRPKPQTGSQFAYGGGGDEVSGGRHGSEYGSGNEVRPQRQEEDGSEYESGYGRPKRDDEEGGGGYGRKPQYGSGFDRPEEPKRYGEEDYSGGGNRRSGEEEGYGEQQSYGGRTDFRRNDEEGYVKKNYGGGYEDSSGYEKPSIYGGEDDVRPKNGESVYTGRPSYVKESYGEDEGRYRKSRYAEDESERYKKSSYGEEESSGYEKPSIYGGEDDVRPKYGESVYTGRPSYVKESYGGEDEGRYRKSGYAEDEGERYKKSSYGEEEESSGYEKPSIYGGEDDERPKYRKESSDDEEKKHRHQKHHHRRDYDED